MLAIGPQYKLDFVIRSGGHSTAGYSANNGVLIDVSKLNSINIDTMSQSASVGTGCTNLELTSRLDQEGLHLPLGDASGVCIGGFMQGGGFGLTSRTYGMNCDSVVSVRVMLADGRIVEANETTNSDLWWAIRGGTGCNFGVLLKINYRLLKRVDMTDWQIGWRISNSMQTIIDVLHFVQENYMLTGSSELNTTISVFWTSEGEDTLPYLMLYGVFVGTKEQAVGVLAPLLKFPGAASSFVPHSNGRRRLTSQREALPNTFAQSRLVYDRRARFVSRRLTKLEWQQVIEQFLGAPCTECFMELDCYGGAVNAVRRGENAFVHRSCAFCAFVQVFWAPQQSAEADRF
jgi:hypothetical protein